MVLGRAAFPTDLTLLFPSIPSHSLKVLRLIETSHQASRRARPPGIYKQEYVAELVRRSNEVV